MLVEHLPPESALNTAIRNATPVDRLTAFSGDSAQAPWSPLELLVAALIDEVRQLSWMYASTHSKNGNVKRPELIRRPGSSQRRGKLMRISDARALDPRLRDLTDDEVRERLSGRAG